MEIDCKGLAIWMCGAGKGSGDQCMVDGVVDVEVLNEVVATGGSSAFAGGVEAVSETLFGA